MTPLDLLQLADASFPAGGFAFSNGLESLAKLGYVKTLDDFSGYLGCHLEQIAAADMPFLTSAFAAAEPPGPAAEPPGPAAEPPGPSSGAEGYAETFATVAKEWDAWIFLPAPRRASLSQGQAWTRAMEAAWDLPGVKAVAPWFRSRAIPLHFLMAFAATLRASGFGLPESRTLLFHMALRDQLGAAVRLGLIGSLQAQRLHRRHSDESESLLRARATRIEAGHAAAERAAPMIDMGQASHPYLYSKLFQS
jgi:urease accessory protein